MVEYIVALSSVFIMFYVAGEALFPAGEGVRCENLAGVTVGVTPRECLIDGIKGYYQGHTFALSLSEYPNSSPALGVPSTLLDLADQLCKDGVCDGISLPSGPAGLVPDFNFDLDEILEAAKPGLSVNLYDVMVAGMWIPEWVGDIPFIGDAVKDALDIELFNIPFPF